MDFRSMFGACAFGETVFVLAKSDVEAEEKAESDKRFKGWKARCVERQKGILIS